MEHDNACTRNRIAVLSGADFKFLWTISEGGEIGRGASIQGELP